MATLYVTNGTDTSVDGQLSLREAIAAAAAGDTIKFDPSLAGASITLTQGTLYIQKHLIIDGESYGITLVGTHSSSNARRTILACTGKNLIQIFGLTFAGGYNMESGFVTRGGGIINSANLHLTRCIIRNCTAYYGGGIYNDGRITLTNCALWYNTCSESGFGSGIYNYGTAIIRNSTIFENTTYQNVPIHSSGTLRVYDSIVMGWVPYNAASCTAFAFNTLLTAAASYPNANNNNYVYDDSLPLFDYTGSPATFTTANLALAANSQALGKSSSGGDLGYTGVATTPADTTPPVITLNGQSTVAVQRDTTYTDAGATATDAADGVFAPLTSGTVDTSTVGTYTITYTATDTSGNTATATRTVNVVTDDVTPPIITLNGYALVVVLPGATYTDAGAIATDNSGATIAVTSSGTVDTTTVGTYTITYTATDPSNNTATATRTVLVREVDVEYNDTDLTGGTYYYRVGVTDGDNALFTNTDVVDVLPTVECSDTSLTPDTYYYRAVVTDDATTYITNSAIATLEAVPADTTPPVITLTGDASCSITVGDTWTDPGATATDNVDASVTVTSSITLGGQAVQSVDTSTAGTYTITYSASDAAGNAATPVTRTVTVNSQPEPYPEQLAAPTLTLTATATTITPTWTAVTNASSYKIRYSTSNPPTGDGDTATSGTDITGLTAATTYYVQAKAIGDGTSYTDSNWGTVATTSTQTPAPEADTTAPVITLIGSANVSLTTGNSWTEPGATVTDNSGETITPVLTITKDGTTCEFSNQTAGTYLFTYTACDAAGNQATPKTRTVVVTELPVWYVTAQNKLAYRGHVEPGVYSVPVTATDPFDNTYEETLSITIKENTAPTDITISNNTVEEALNGQEVGQLEAVDQDEDDTHVFTVGVVTRTGDAPTGTGETGTGEGTGTGSGGESGGSGETETWSAPVITLNGNAMTTLSFGTSYVELGATAVDHGGASVTVTTSGYVNYAVPGLYTITYSATDSHSQTSTKTRTVTVVDPEAPQLLLLGETSMTLYRGEEYTEPGAFAFDTVDGVLTSSVVISGEVDIDTVGTYTLTYSVADAANNTTTATRTVSVIDHSILLIGESHTGNCVVLEWNEIADAVFTIKRSVDGTIWVDLGNTSHDYYHDNFVQFYTGYYYKVESILNGVTITSNTVYVVTAGLGETATIDAPGFVDASVPSTGSVRVRWEAVYGAVGYVLQRTDTPALESSWTTIATFNASGVETQS